jgi:hypothetical protein
MVQVIQIKGLKALKFESDQGGSKIAENDTRGEMIQFSYPATVMAEKVAFGKVMRIQEALLRSDDY